MSSPSADLCRPSLERKSPLLFLVLLLLAAWAKLSLGKVLHDFCGECFSGESLLVCDSMREVVKTFSRESWVVKVVL
jgi:hypothetical protein